MSSDEKRSHYDQQDEAVRDLLGDLGLSNDFFHRLWLEDDWSFVLKVHALFEAAITDQLVARLGVPELAPVFSRMRLNDTATGKMAFAKKLKLVDKKYRRFLRELSELRNQLAHNISGAEFTFADWQRKLDRNQRKKARDAFCVGFEDAGDTDRYFVEDPKFAIWASSLCLLSLFTLGKKVIGLSRELEVRREVERHLNEIYGNQTLDD